MGAEDGDAYGRINCLIENEKEITLSRASHQSTLCHVYFYFTRLAHLSSSCRRLFQPGRGERFSLLEQVHLLEIKSLTRTKIAFISQKLKAALLNVLHQNVIPSPLIICSSYQCFSLIAVIHSILFCLHFNSSQMLPPFRWKNTFVGERDEQLSLAVHLLSQRNSLPSFSSLSSYFLRNKLPLSVIERERARETDRDRDRDRLAAQVSTPRVSWPGHRAAMP